MIIKDELNNKINNYDIWLQQNLTTYDTFGTNVFNDLSTASPLRQLITLIRFIDWCESPSVIIMNIRNSILYYNNEFVNHIRYLLMSNIPLKITYLYNANHEPSFIENIKANLNIEQIYNIKQSYCLDLFKQHIKNNCLKYEINEDNLIVVYDKNNISKQLLLSDNLIIISDQNFLSNIRLYESYFS